MRSYTPSAPVPISGVRDLLALPGFEEKAVCPGSVTHMGVWGICGDGGTRSFCSSSASEYAVTHSDSGQQKLERR